MAMHSHSTWLCIATVAMHSHGYAILACRHSHVDTSIAMAMRYWHSHVDMAMRHQYRIAMSRLTHSHVETVPHNMLFWAVAKWFFSHVATAQKNEVQTEKKAPKQVLYLYEYMYIYCVCIYMEYMCVYICTYMCVCAHQAFVSHGHVASDR